MQPHRINLKGPWEYEWIERASGLADADDQENAAADVEQTARVVMPAEWREQFGAVAGRVRFRRRFGCPTNLEPGERLFLVFDGVGGSGSVRVGNKELGEIWDGATTARFELTGLLEPRNELTVELNFDPNADTGRRGGLWGPVAIEIHRQ